MSLASQSAMTKYVAAIRRTLHASLTLQNFYSQMVERHDKPEVEMQQCRELLLTPVTVSRSQEERVLIEASINAVRVSVRIKQLDDVDKMVCRKLCRFMQMRADAFKVLRTKTGFQTASGANISVSCRGGEPTASSFDISLLLTNAHCEELHKRELIEFVVTFIEGINHEISELKLAVNARARICCEEFLKKF